MSCVQLLSLVELFGTTWIAVYQASLSSTLSWSWLKFILIKIPAGFSHRNRKTDAKINVEMLKIKKQPE